MLISLSVIVSTATLIVADANANQQRDNYQDEPFNS